MILSKQVLFTEVGFSACLALHWPDHTYIHTYIDYAMNHKNYYWQCNWRAAWTSSRVCAGKRRTLRATVTIFSHMSWIVLAFVKCDTIFKLFFFWNYHRHKFELLNFTR